MRKPKQAPLQPLGDAERFFFDHAGYCYDPKTETAEQGHRKCAAHLAQAERFAHTAGWFSKWIRDYEADPNDWDGDGPIGQKAYGCILHDAQGKPLESLFGIWDPDMNYRRVVETELALEAMWRWQSAYPILDTKEAA